VIQVNDDHEYALPQLQSSRLEKKMQSGKRRKKTEAISSYGKLSVISDNHDGQISGHWSFHWPHPEDTIYYAKSPIENWTIQSAFQSEIAVSFLYFWTDAKWIRHLSEKTAEVSQAYLKQT